MDALDRVSGRRVVGLVARGLARTAAATVAIWLVVALSTGFIGFDRAAVAQRLFGADPTEPLTAGERRAVEDLALRYTVTVEAMSCRGRSVGSGFDVGDLVLTNQHIVLDASTVRVAASGPVREFPAVVPDADLDLAVVDGTVASAGDDAHALVLASDEAPIGAPVIVAGRGDGRPRVVDALIHGYTSGGPYGIDGDVMLLDRAVVPGWSGGPVLNRRGEVVGMVQAVDTVTGLTLAVPVERLRSSIDEMEGVPWSSDTMQLDPADCIATNGH